MDAEGRANDVKTQPERLLRDIRSRLAELRQRARGLSANLHIPTDIEADLLVALLARVTSGATPKCALDECFKAVGSVKRGGTFAVSVRDGRLVVEVVDVPSCDPGHVGSSGAFLTTMELALRAALTNSTVLILGETGTGKDLVARTIHQHSPRRERPFVVVDCGAFSETLLEAELFGHAKGAFTGAAAERVGAIEAAEGGTVFLDEIGEMPLTMQPRLLRVIESRTVRRVGENQHRRVDVRFVAATHRDLAAMVNAGNFRGDLRYRLKVIELKLPSLRERREDIEPLLNYFLHKFSKENLEFSPEALHALTKYAWPGNVREIRNTVEHAVAFANGVIQADDLPPEVHNSTMTICETGDSSVPTKAAVIRSTSIDDSLGLTERRDRDDRDHIMRVLKKCHNNKTHAAQTLKLTPKGLRDMMRRLGIKNSELESR